MKAIVKGAGHWIGLLVLTDAVYLFVTWIIRREALEYMALFLFLFTLLACLAGIWMEYRRQKKAEEALSHFLELPDDRAKGEMVQQLMGQAAVESLAEQLLDQRDLANGKTVELSQYREYIEAWVHEAKTPLSLSTLVLENHKEEMSPYVYGRMRYIQHQLGEAVDRILYYARLLADHADDKFEEFSLAECLEEVLEEYRPFLEEKRIGVEERLLPLAVISDRRVVRFMLSQLLGNAVKYADSSEGRILLAMEERQDQVCLGIYNNGPGVPPQDAPFVFDKGFTGSSPNRQKATGMGLYLVGKYAKRMCVEAALAQELPFGEGFGIELVFTL